MSLIKKIDVEAHFAERRRRRLVASGFAKQSTSERVLVIATEAASADASVFKKDFSVEHSFKMVSATSSE